MIVKRKIREDEEDDANGFTALKRSKGGELASPESSSASPSDYVNDTHTEEGLLGHEELRLRDGNGSTSTSSPDPESQSESVDSEGHTDNDEVSAHEYSEISPSSSSGESSLSFPSDEESRSESEEIVNVQLRPQPWIRSTKASDLTARLSSLLPALAAANAALDQDRKDGTLAQKVMDLGDGEEGQYIEMVCQVMSGQLLILIMLQNLGLGVLEKSNHITGDTTSSSSSSSEGEDGGSSRQGRPKCIVKTDAMTSLMGGKSMRPKIEEVDGG
jgi:hypothetical protein